MDVEFIDFEQLKARKDEWARFVEKNNQCWLYHHPVFVCPNENMFPSFGIMQKNGIIGICICSVMRSGFGNVLLGNPGLALSENIPKKIYAIIREHLIKIAFKYRCHSVQMTLTSLAPANGKLDYLGSHLYPLNFTSCMRWGYKTHYVPSYSTHINLKGSLDNFVASCSENIRRKVKKFSKKDHKWLFSDNEVKPKQWREFLELHKETLNRSGAPSLSKKMLELLVNLFDHNMAVLINVYIDNECCAALLLLTYKKGAFYFASGTSETAYRMGAAAYVHYIAVKELKKKGFKTYDLGQFFPTLSGLPLHGIGEFKRRFGGEKKPVIAGELILNDWKFLILDYLPSYFKKMITGSVPETVIDRLRTSLSKIKGM